MGILHKFFSHNGKPVLTAQPLTVVRATIGTHALATPTTHVFFLHRRRTQTRPQKKKKVKFASTPSTTAVQVTNPKSKHSFSPISDLKKKLRFVDGQWI